MNRKPSRKPSSLPVIRQGDVLLQPAASLPAGCTLVPLDRGRIVLAYGEVTGHAHAIADHGAPAATQARTIGPQAAAEIAEAAIARAKLWRAPDGSHAAAASTWRNADGSLAFRKFTDYTPRAES